MSLTLIITADKDTVFKLGNLSVTDTTASAIPQLRNNNASLRNLKSLILLTYYDDDVHIQTCDEKLLLAILQGNLICLFLIQGASDVLPSC